jgi:hypothetical protein
MPTLFAAAKPRFVCDAITRTSCQRRAVRTLSSVEALSTTMIS